MAEQKIKSEKNQKKELIVKTAFKLFKTYGFYATGVDLIMREAGVSKRTLYKYFRTKNDLIVAVLEYYRMRYQKHMDYLLKKNGNSAREKILAIFEDAKHWFDDVNFHGCLAVNAMGEFSGKEEAIENSCIRFKQWEIELLKGLTKDIVQQNSAELAYKLFVLLEGVSSIAQVTKGNYPVDITLLADQMIADHLRE